MEGFCCYMSAGLGIRPLLTTKLIVVLLHSGFRSCPVQPYV